MTTKEGARLSRNISFGRFQSPEDIAPTRRLLTEYGMQAQRLSEVLSERGESMGQGAWERRRTYLGHLRTRIARTEVLLEKAAPNQ